MDLDFSRPSIADLEDISCPAANSCTVVGYAAASIAYADICARRTKLGRPISRFDAMVAAICRTHEATLYTRNIKDFSETQVDVVNPWAG